MGGALATRPLSAAGVEASDVLSALPAVAREYVQQSVIKRACMIMDGSIAFAFLGIVDYCPSVDRAESRQSKCDVPRIRCESNHHRLRLTPK
jgi:hypothetical protein